jgi:hypothetical protein
VCCREILQDKAFQGNFWNAKEKLRQNPKLICEMLIFGESKLFFLIQAGTIFGTCLF